MPLNTASQNPNTFDVIPSRADYGTARGSCSFFELPTAGNTFGDTIQVVDVGMRVYTWDGSAWIDPVESSGMGTITLSANYTLTPADDQKQFTCTTALTITVPELLSPRPSFIVNAPPTGNVSLDPTGAAQLNGATTTLTRSRANNPAGFVVTAYAESDGYGVSGS